MIRELHLDLSQLTVSPDPSRGRMVSAPAMTPRTSTERAAMKASMELAKPLNARMGAALDVLGISETRPAVSVIPSPVVPMASRHSFDLTCALGETGTAGWVLGANASGGIYASTTPEFGVYGSVGVVFGMFAGIGAGLEWTMIFGTPSDFAGPFICFQASVGPKIFGGCAIGGSLLFSVVAPAAGRGSTLAFMGFSVNVTCGWSALPVSVSIEYSNTWIHPLIK